MRCYHIRMANCSIGSNARTISSILCFCNFCPLPHSTAKCGLPLNPLNHQQLSPNHPFLLIRFSS